MQPWFEGLSEEWVPQGTPTGTQSSPRAPQESQSVPPKLQSRIPRLRHSSGSFSEIQIRQVAKNLRLPKPRSALAERSLSDNNLPPTPTAVESPVPRSRSASESFAASSQGSVVYSGTVAQKPIPPSSDKAHQYQDTPEWRRRLLNGEAGYGDQKDLFSPMGLENIFQKPSGGSAEGSKPRKSRLGLSSALPSSPPPWPNTDRNESECDARDTQKTVKKEGGRDDESVHTDNSVYFSSINELEVPTNQEAPRTVSGQIEFENENFSPVYLSNLQVGPDPRQPNFSASSLAQRLQHLGTPQPVFKHRLVTEGNSIAQDPSQCDSSLAKLQDDTLPEDLPAGTPDIGKQLSPFVETKRGGYSQDDSFRRRPLSPSPRQKAVGQKPVHRSQSAHTEHKGCDTANELDAETDRGSPSLRPVTPRRSEKSKFLSPERARTSGSPLKLFDAHDTFTSNRLQRRLSQLEQKPDKFFSTTNEMDSTRLVQKTSRMTSLEEVSVQNALERSANATPAPPSPQESRRAGTFGEGELDQYTFPEEFSALSSHDSPTVESCPDSSPPTDVAPPGFQKPIRFQYDASSQSFKSSKARRQGLTRVSNPLRKVTYSQSHALRRPRDPEPEPETNFEQEYAEGKRGPTSPAKDPTRKRRRTLYSVYDEESHVLNDSEANPATDSHVAMQSAIGKTREASGNGRYSSMADPEILAQRQILRPRNPTPNHRMRDESEIHAEVMEATEAFMLSSPKMDNIRGQLGSPASPGAPEEAEQAALIANEIAAFNMNRPPVARNERRKRSVTTQDFLDEAVKIMDYIRAKGRPNSGLESLEESQSESIFMPNNDPLPSSPLTFSRPPSREGRLSEWRQPNQHNLDPKVMSHLRKYQERESDDFMGSSVRSWRIPERKLSSTQEENSVIVEQGDIRITDKTDRENKDVFNAGACLDAQKAHDTHQSASSSLGQTINTNVSRRSEHVATLAPEAVAHLIPEQIAGMSFDREKNIWVRNKSPSKEHHPTEEISTNAESEEDPFDNIPDLTVDETAEIMLKNQASPSRPQPTAETFLEETEENAQAQQDESRPVTRDGKGTAPTEASSVPSKFSNNFAWSYPKTETRATSWSDQETRNGASQKQQHAPTTTYPIPESDEVDVEHEIKYFEGRDAGNTPYPNRTLRDITFSIGQTREADSPNLPKRQPQWSYANGRQSSRPQGMPWRQIPGSRTLPASRRENQVVEGDMSALEGPPSRNYRMQLSMSLQPQNALMTLPSSPAKADVTFMLSDLPEFTLNQVDECEVQDRVVVKHDGTKFSKALEDRYAQGTADLIKALQDVAPDEPFWEDLRKLDLRDKGLTNLHRLEEFCYRLEELDASNNSISQLKGVPFTMRRLKMGNNTLTGLTSWASFVNLQHLDLSNNDIDSLDGLSELVHLRMLNVDNNHINSLDGLLLLDGLMELSASGNQIETVDFGKADMKSLRDLDLSNNQLVEVRNLHCLPQLRNLDLDNNCMDEFPATDMPMAKCKLLRSLRLCKNGMTSLDVAGYCPGLESLYVDDNSLVHLPGIGHLRHLRTFSAREQLLPSKPASDVCARNLLHNPDVRNLYISGNPTRCLQISQHLLNLQRLEVSSMGLEELPDDFGQLTPNIRSINLNFNSLRDLRPLLNIKRLDELLVAGNKLARLRTNLAVLGKLITLTKLDLRDNPLTLRFYPPTSENRVMSLRRKHADNDDDGNSADRFVLPDGDPEDDRQYLQRLDFETRLRRRVQEIMLSTQCGSLRELDGLPFDRARILVKDDIWERLVFLGVIRRAEGTEQAERQ